VPPASNRAGISHEPSAEKRLPNMTILSIAPLLAKTIRRIHVGKSVSELFDV
jgi:phosphoribosylpyrophosphate synthetase